MPGISEDLRLLIRHKRRFALARVPDEEWPEDRQQDDAYRAFSYNTSETAAAWQEFYEGLGDTLVAEWTIAPGRIVHLYKIDKVLNAQRAQELRDEQAAMIESHLAAHAPAVTTE